MVVFSITEAKHMRASELAKMILHNFISLPALTVYMENSMRFEISLRSI